MKSLRPRTRILGTSIAALVSPLLALIPQQAEAETWVPTAAGTTYDWGTAANWSPATVPNSVTAVANINNNIVGAQTILLNANRTVNDLNLGDSDGTHGFTIATGTAGSLLIFGGTNPTMDITGNAANTISAAIRADANVTFRSTSTAETTISAAMTGAAVRNITFNNDINGVVTAPVSLQGQFALTAANTLGGATGTVAINDVRVRGTVAGAFGANAANTVTVSGGGQMFLTGGTHVNNLVLNSTGWVETAGNLGALRIENSNVSGTVALQQNAIIGVNANNTGTLSGVVSGNFGITKVGGTATSGQGILLLSGANTFTGAVTVNNGSIQASNASALGTNANVTVNASPVAGGDGNRLILSGTITIGSGKTLTLNSAAGDFRSMLLNNANNNTWAGNIVAGGAGITQVSAAANTTLTIAGGVTSTGGGGAGTLFTRGTGTVVYNGVINLGADRKFTKTDAGTVIVTSTGNSWTQTQAANGQIQIGANNALAGVSFIFGENNGNNGRLELNGFSQAVTGLSTFATSTGTNHIIRNSNLTTASTLTFATPTATTDILKNVQVQGTATGLGTLHMVSNGLGRTEFQDGLVGANSWTVNSGTVAFTGATNRVLPGSVTGLVGATIEKAGTATLAATSTWNNAGTTNVTGGALALGAGTAGGINVSDGATLATGLGGGVLTSSAVTFGTVGATVYVPLLTNPLVAPLTATSLTNAGTAVTVAPQAGSFVANTTYRLLDYTSGSGVGGFALAPVGSYPHITATLDTATAGQVNLVVGAVDTLIWAGQTSAVWDVNTTSNFALASSSFTGAPFFSGDAVAFNDTHDVGAAATPVTNSDITGGAVTIGNLSFNNSAVTYSVANALTGAGGITKTGTGAVTLSAANTYAGATSVSGGTLTLSGANLLGGGAVSVTGGTLKIGNSDALRGAGSITVSGGGTFDANGTAVGTRYPELVVSGAGVGGNGAIVNNGIAITNNSHFAKITLAGDTTWGGSGRYDLVAGQIFAGGAFTLTKTGAGELWYNPSAGSVLENVVVNQGVFGSQGVNPLSTTATVTVNNGGTHQIFAANAQQHKVELNDGGILRQSNAAAGTINGQVTLNGSTTGRNIQAFAGGTLNIAGKLTGTGGFTVNEGGIVQLQNAANDYAGDTKITLGTLNFSATGIIPATTNLIIDGGTFATGNLARTIGSLSGNGGTISGGNVLTNNQSTTTVWNGSLNGTTLTMSGAGSLTLGGTADNSAGTLIINSGTVIVAKGNTAPVAQTVHVSGSNGVTVNGGTLQLGGTYDNTTTPGTGINLAPAGINTATYVDNLYNNGPVNLNAGTFDLNGRQEAINGLTSTGLGGTVTNTAAATAAKLFVGHQNATSTFGGAINDGTGTVAIEKIGTGTLTLTGTSNFSGGLTQTVGAVTVNAGATLGNTPITVAANTFTFDGTQGTGAIAVNGTSVFTGAGTSGGVLTAASGTTLRVGTASAGTAATTLTLGGLNLSGGANLNLDFNSAGTTVDKIATTVSNGVSISGANNLNVVLSGAGWVTGTYPILTYAGAVGGVADNTTLVLSTPVGHSTVNVVDNTTGLVNLVVTSTANKWVGGNGNAWDTGTTLNWNAADQFFLTGDTVVFDDTATTFTPNIAANQTAAGVTFDNTTAYTLTSTGTFGIAGTGGLIKKNTGTVTISSANTYTGATDVQQGTLIANFNTGTAQTVFAAASTINVAGGATFKAVANDANITLANNLTGTGTVVIDPHLTAGAGVRDVVISGNNAGFTGTLRLSPTTDVASGLGTFRTNAALTPAGAGGATIDVDAGGQAYLAAGTFPNNFTITGHGYAETEGATPTAVSGLTQYSGTAKGGIGAIRMSGNTIISGNVTLDGSAKITPYNATGTISGSIGVTNSTDILSVGGVGNVTSTLILTGTNNIGANALNKIVVNAGGTAGTNVLQIGSLGTTGTLGTGDVTLYTDAAAAMLRVQRSDGYTLAQNVIAAHNGTPTNLTRASFVANTQGTGVSVGGNTIDLTDGTGTIANSGNVFVAGHGGTNGVNNAIFNIDLNSIVKTGNIFVGDQSGFTGTINQSGTSSVSVAGRLQIGHYPNNTSVYNLTSGTIATTANPGLVTNPSGGGEQVGGIYLGIDGTGVMSQSGGTVTTDWVVLDNRGNTGAGTNQPDGVDRYSLSGGALEIRGAFGIANRNATTEFNFTGGTIKNVGTGVNVGVSGVGAFVIGTGGTGTPTIDTNGATNQVTFSRNVTGSGTLSKEGAGTLNLNAASPAWTGDLVLVGGTTATNAASGGFGSFTTPGRTITIAGTSTTALFSVNDVFGDGVGNANMPTLVIDGGTLSSTRYNVIGEVSLSGGTLTQASTDGPGASEGFQFRGDVSVSGGAPSLITTTNGKANHLGPNTAFDVEDVTLNTSADLTIATPLANQSATFVSAAGSLTKDGAGTLVLSGASTYTGTTTVNAGTLQVDGDISTSTLVFNGGTLSGSGTVGAVTIASGTTLAPGSSPGILFTDDLAFSGGTAAFEIFGATAGLGYDQVSVTGGISFTANTALTLDLGAFDPADNVDVFTLALNDSGDAVGLGGFGFVFGGNPLSEGEIFTASGQDFLISYAGGSGNDITLAAVPEPGSAVLLLGGLLTIAGLRRRRA